MSEHTGHRQRMRERLRKEGMDYFAPHEILEVLLYYAIPRGDTNPVAHRLLNTFGTLDGVLEASPEQLMQVEGMGQNAASLLSMLVPVFRAYTAAVAAEKKTIHSRAEAEQHCLALLSGRSDEHFYLLCLNADHRLLGQRLIAEGTVGQVAAYPRKIMQAVLETNAACVILCHNHPGGTAEPSPEDLTSTKAICSLLDGIDVLLLDHIIVAGGSTYSMAQHGDL